jgi:protein-tyrosine-phosphatase
MTMETHEAEKKNILFLCSWNAVRSPMAHYIMRKYFSETHKAYSAGLEASDYMDPFAISIMRDKEGLNLINFEPQDINDLLKSEHKPEKISSIIALSEQAYQYIKQNPLKDFDYSIEFWDTPSPSRHEQNRDITLAAYMDIYKTIKDHIFNRFDY